MKNSVLFFIFSFFSLTVFGQDTLFMKSGEVVKAKILVVTESDVSYKKITYLDGPTFIVAKNKIAKIIYADGSVEIFNDIPAHNSSADSSGLMNNIIAINPLSLVGGNVSFSYERLSKNGKFGFRIPFYAPVTESSGNQLGINLDFKFYLGKKDVAKYYLGPSIAGFAAYHGYFNLGFMFDNGVSLQPFKKFNITIDAAAGIAHTDLYNTAAFLNVFIWRAGINFGLKF
ncbi:hypothetical protein BH09BAC5_BH09BAC5_22470 [soil metagenome]